MWIELFKTSENATKALLAEMDQIAERREGMRLSIEDQVLLQMFSNAGEGAFSTTKAYIEKELQSFRNALKAKEAQSAVLNLYGLANIKPYLYDVHGIAATPQTEAHPFFACLRKLSANAYEVGGAYSPDKRGAEGQIVEELGRGNPWA